MPELFVFLLKVNAALIVFCLAYYAVLRRLTFYTLNRFFLIAGIVFSSVYPFVDPAILFGQHKELVKPLAAALPQAYLMAEQVAEIDYWLIMKIIFWLGVVFMAVRMSIRFYSLYLIHKKSVPGVVSAYPVRLLDGEVSTFSFWNNIYLNPGHHASEELGAILEHEQVHVQQLHTVDILLAELSTVFYWFNPGVWYMRKAVKENVEFITDQNVLQKGVDRRAYQYSMLSPQLLTQPSVLMNNFNVTGIKRRIQMMNKKRSSEFQLVRYLFLLPVLLVITTAFTFFRKEVKESKVYKNTITAATNAFRLTPSSDQNGIEISVSHKAVIPKIKRQIKKKQNKKATVIIPSRIKAIQADTIKRQQPLVFTVPAATAGKVSDIVVIRYNLSEPRKPINLDSIRLNSANVNFTFVKREGEVSEAVKLRGVPSENSSATTDVSLKEVHVIGYAKGKPRPASYVNDKLISPEDLAKLNPADISSVKVKSDPEKETGKAIFIYSRSANN